MTLGVSNFSTFLASTPALKPLVFVFLFSSLVKTSSKKHQHPATWHHKAKERATFLGDLLRLKGWFEVLIPKKWNPQKERSRKITIPKQHFILTATKP